MTDLRQAAQAVLDAWDSPLWKTGTTAAKIADLRAALEQQAEPVSHAVIAGALFDFMGWLTTRKKRLVLSSTDNASPAVESITEFAKMRGLSLDDAKVQDWNTTPPQQQAEPVAVYQWRKQGCADWYDGHPDYSDCGGPYETRTLRIAAMQVRPSEFCQMVEEKETVTGIPMYWAEWPSKEVV